jgi:hypothetical protein
LADSPAAPADDAHDGELDDPEVCDGLSRAVPDAVLRLLAWHAASANGSSTS